jgi:4-hydroxybenzoate polyprenyltransferase
VNSDPFYYVTILVWNVSGAIALWTWVNELLAAKQDHDEVKAANPRLKSSVAATKTALYSSALFTLMAALFLGVGVIASLFGSPSPPSPYLARSIVLRLMLSAANVALAVAGALQRPGRDELIRALRSEQRLYRQVNGEKEVRRGIHRSDEE